MSRDYAKYRTKHKISNKKNRYIEIFIIISLLFMISAAGYWIYTHKLKGAFATNTKLNQAVNNFKTFFHPQKSTVAKATHINPPVKEDVQFDFYTELANMQIKPTAATPIVTPTTLKNPIISGSLNNSVLKKPSIVQPKFIVRLGSFKDVNSASEMRISLLLSGVDVEVVKSNQDYYLRQGFYATLNKAKEIQRKLQQKGIDTIILQE